MFKDQLAEVKPNQTWLERGCLLCSPFSEKGRADEDLACVGLERLFSQQMSVPFKDRVLQNRFYLVWACVSLSWMLFKWRVNDTLFCLQGFPWGMLPGKWMTQNSLAQRQLWCHNYFSLWHHMPNRFGLMQEPSSRCLWGGRADNSPSQ